MQYQNTIIGKILTPINRRKFKHFVDKYKGDFATKKMRCWEQFVAILLGQLGNCSSLREMDSSAQQQDYIINNRLSKYICVVLRKF